MTDEAGTISELIVIAAESEVAALAPAVAPGVSEQPVALALGAAVAFDLAPAGGDGGVGVAVDLTKANERNRMVWSTNLRATAEAITIIDDATNVVLDAFVKSHRNSDHTLTSQLLQIPPRHMIIDLEVIDLEKYRRLRHLVALVIPEIVSWIEPALFLPVEVLVIVRAGQAMVLRVVEGVLGLAAETANVWESVAVDELLLGEGRDLGWVIDVVVTSVEVFDGCDSVMSPAGATLLLVLDSAENFALSDPVNHWTVDQLLVNELIVSDVHAHSIDFVHSLVIPLLPTCCILVLQSLEFPLESLIHIFFLI